MMKNLFGKTDNNVATETDDKIDNKSWNMKILKYPGFSNESFGALHSFVNLLFMYRVKIDMKKYIYNTIS